MIVSSRKFDEKTFGAQKYDNNESWNTVGGLAPNGVCATRWQRKLDPDVSRLSPLAEFLATSGNGINVSGKMPHPRRECRVVVFNGKTVADENNWSDGDRACYGALGDEPAKINDWLFDIIQPNESDEDYLNRQADKILAAGAVMVRFNNMEWRK